MRANVGELFLTESQAACLVTLRHGTSMPELAIRAMLPLAKAESGLAVLSDMGLAVRDQAKKWHITARGLDFQFATIPDADRRDDPLPGTSGQRLLDLLDRPIAVAEIVKRSGLSQQDVRRLVVKLHARGLVKFGDPDKPFRLVMRPDDQTILLSRAEERVLSAVPADYATTVSNIRRIVHIPEDTVLPIVEKLAAHGLVEAFDGLQGARLYRITATGSEHPQRRRSARLAQATRVGVQSDRVHAVLAALADAGALGIADVSQTVGVPYQSINALMQYLKRKQLVKKTRDGFGAPYCLTEQGHAALAEMARRRAA